MKVSAQDTSFSQQGPSGGTGGDEFTDDAGSGKIRGIAVRQGEVVNAIQIFVEDDKGNLHQLDQHGGGGGDAAPFFSLARGEYIKKVSGMFGQYIDSLTIQTNMQTRSYGGGGGTVSYTYSTEADEEVYGFTGRSGEFLDSIGVLIRKRA